jgi:cellulose biosynthesis protein BcsQ
MITFGLYNSKGGVGKTAAAVNLAYLASREGLKTLLWDLDPQSASTFYYRIKPRIDGGAKSMMRSSKNLGHYIKKTQFEKLELLPSDFSTRKLDTILDAMKKPKKHLKKMIRNLPGKYDIVFMDSPPGFSLLSENIILAADYILFPMIPTTLSMRTYQQVIRYFEKMGLEFSRIIPFFALVDGRKKIHREIVAEYRNNQSLFLKSAIPYASEVEKMGARGAPLLSYSTGSKAAIAYRSLWSELKARSLPIDIS